MQALLHALKGLIGIRTFQTLPSTAKPDLHYRRAFCRLLFLERLGGALQSCL